jgi:hypothetical protein
MRSRLHVPEGAAAYFPEIAGAKLVEMANGKTKYVVEPKDPGPNVLPYVDRAGICILCRNDSPRKPEPISPDEAALEIELHLDPGFDRFAATIGDAMLRVAAEAGAWRLYVSGTPSSMVPRIESLLDQLGRSAS